MQRKCLGSSLSLVWRHHLSSIEACRTSALHRESSYRVLHRPPPERPSRPAPRTVSYRTEESPSDLSGLFRLSNLLPQRTAEWSRLFRRRTQPATSSAARWEGL